jgi:hypothetical protein
MSKWAIQFKAIHPTEHDKTWAVGIKRKTITDLMAKDDAYLARTKLLGEILESDGVVEIYAGWGRANFDDCYIYVGRPENDYHKIESDGTVSIVAPAPPDCVFLILICNDGTIDNWFWRKAARGCPDGITGERVYERKSIEGY